jgi:hypothetical protein
MRVSITVHNGSQTAIEDVRVVARGSTTLRVEKAGPTDLLERRQSVVIEAVIVPGASALDSRAGNGSSRDDPYLQDRYEAPIELELEVRIQGETITVPFKVPIEVRPAVQMIPLPRGLLLPTGTRSTEFVVRVRRNSQAAVRERFRVSAPNGWATSFPTEEILLDQETVKDYSFSLALPELVEDSSYMLNVSLGSSRLSLRARKVDLVVDRKLAVGLVRGVDDAVEAALRGLGVQLRILNDDDLDPRSLAQLRTIVVDIRALKLREGARAGFDRLLRFAEGGGRLVVLYHKDVEFNLESAHFRGAPYPLVIGKGRITNERAPVALLAPDHSLLNVPNRIREQDWDGWEQERGLYFAERFDSRYEPLLSIREDKDSPEQRGALLYARTGKGDYVYCALALFRQLKFLHPGACRLLADLITPRPE